MGVMSGLAKDFISIKYSESIGKRVFIYILSKFYRPIVASLTENLNGLFENERSF